MQSILKKISLVLTLLIINSISLKLNAQTIEIDSIETLLAQDAFEGNDSLQNEALRKIVLYYLNNDIEKAIFYCKQGLEFSENLNVSSMKFEWYHFTGFVYEKTEMYSLAIENYQKGLDVCIKNDFNTGWWHISIGNIYYGHSSNYEKAIECYNKAIRDFEKLKTKDPIMYKLGIAVAFNNIGMSYEKQKKYGKGLEYYLQAYYLREKLQRSYELSHSCLLIGSFYHETGNQDSALVYYNKGIEYCKSADNKEFGIDMYLNKARLLSENDNLKQALIECSYAKQLVFETGRERDKPMIYLAFSQVYSNVKKYNKSLGYALEAKIMADSLNDNTTMPDILEHLADISEKLNDIPAAYSYLTEYRLLQKEIKKEEVKKLQFNFEKEQNEKEVLLLNQNINRLRNQTKIRLGFIILTSILLIVTILFLLVFWKIRRKEKKAEQALKDSEAKLQESNKTKDKFFSIIAHDLRSPFNTLLGFSDILSKNHKKYDVEERERIIKLINNSSKNTFNLLENLLTWSRSQLGRIEFLPKEINIKALIYEIVLLFQSNAKNKSIGLFYDTETNISVYADKNMTNTVLRNLITNAIKFTKKNGTVTISVSETKKQDFIEISVTDTGVGIAKDKIDELFRIDKDTSTPGTENESGTGLGLILCKEFVEKHGGEIWVESEVDKGSKFIFTLPTTM